MAEVTPAADMAVEAADSAAATAADSAAVDIPAAFRAGRPRVDPSAAAASMPIVDRSPDRLHHAPSRLLLIRSRNAASRSAVCRNAPSRVRSVLRTGFAAAAVVLMGMGSTDSATTASVIPAAADIIRGHGAMAAITIRTGGI